MLQRSWTPSLAAQVMCLRRFMTAATALNRIPACVMQVFGERATSTKLKPLQRLRVSSTKGATGHLLGAAGAIEAVFSVLALAHRCAPPTLNLNKQQPRLLSGISGPGTGTTLPQGPIAVMSNSFGFGGTNAALLLTSPPTLDDW